MEPNLRSKIEFFQRLEALNHEDEDLGQDEEALRAESKAFKKDLQSTSTSKRPSPPSAIVDAPHLRKVASDPLSDGKGDESKAIIIEDTPETRRRAPKRAVPNAAESPSAEDLLVPDTTRPSKPAQMVTHNLLRNAVSRSSVDAGQDSPSIKAGNKRKRQEKSLLKMVPEARQWLKGLSFFYIPNDDVNKARRARITKAREHGAYWTRDIKEATHIIVDKQLNYSDIEALLKGTPGSNMRILVNENYPLDCLLYNTLLNADQVQYKVAGLPDVKSSESESESEALAPHESQASDKSLELKVPRNNPLRWDYVPPQYTQQSGISSQRNSEPVVPNVVPSSISEQTSKLPVSTSHGPSYDENVGSRDPSNRTSSRPAAKDSISRPDVHADELSEYIQLVQEKFREIPLDGDEEPPSLAQVDGTDDIDTGNGSSVEDRYQNKPRSKKSKSNIRQKDTNWRDKFSCMKGATKGATKGDTPDTTNARTIEVLQSMCEYYSRTNDHWRIYAYRKAIATLKQVDWKVTSYEEAIELSNVGTSIATKIEEIVRTDRLRKLECLQTDPVTDVLDLFLNIYGVGLGQANMWIAQGYRTLEDLKQKAHLTTNQRIGIDHYDDLKKRIPRCEVTSLAECVKRAAAVIDPSVELIVGGSYRRGSESSGDIDFIVTKAETSSSDDLIPFFDLLFRKLSEEGFLTATLASLHHTTKKGSHKSVWHGCCVLPQSDFPGEKANYRPIWRRIDFLLVPETEYGAALIYFTGNDIFNRSMRLLASKKQMRLNQRGLYKDVMRCPNRVKLSEGQLVEGRDERKIFEILCVTWREPHERWC